MKAKFIIKDWAGNRMFPEKEFESADDAWEFILTQFENEEDLQDIFVDKKDG